MGKGANYPCSLAPCGTAQVWPVIGRLESGARPIRRGLHPGPLRDKTCFALPRLIYRPCLALFSPSASALTRRVTEVTGQSEAPPFFSRAKIVRFSLVFLLLFPFSLSLYFILYTLVQKRVCAGLNMRI